MSFKPKSILFLGTIAGLLGFASSPLNAQGVRVLTQTPGSGSTDELYERRVQEFMKNYEKFRDQQDRQFDQFFEEEFFGSPAQALQKIEAMQKQFSILLMESARAGLLPTAPTPYRISQEGKADATVYRIDVPDLEKKNFKVEVKDGLLRISEENRQAGQANDPSSPGNSQNAFLGQFQKIIPLPEGVDPKSVQYRKEKDQILVIVPKIKPSLSANP